MKLNVKKVIMVFLLVLVLLASLIVEAQTKQFGESDKAQIVATILKRQKFKDPEYPSSNAEETVFLLADGVSFQLLPKIKGIKFVPITEKQVDEMKKTGVEYYSFSEFEVKGRKVDVTFARYYIHYRVYSYGNATAYECQKVSGRWKVKGGKPNVWVAESN